MNPGQKKNGMWKTIAVASLGILATGSGSWLVFGADKVSRDEVQKIVERELKSLHVRFDYLEKRVDQIWEKIK